MLGALALIPGVGPFLSGAMGIIGFILQCRACMIAIGLGAAFIAGDIYGRDKANEACQEAVFKAEAAASKRDAEAQKAAAEFVRKRNAELSAENADLDKKGKDYEAHIATLDAKIIACRRGTDDDDRRLRDTGTSTPRRRNLR